MAERVPTSGGSIREGAQQLRREMSSEHLNERLGEVVSQRPLLGHLLEWRVVGRALAVAAAVCLVFLLLVGPRSAAVLLVLSFFGAWFVLGARHYEQRRPTTPAGEGEGEQDGNS